MAKNLYISKVAAAAFIVLTVSSIAGIVTMIILYKTQISTMNPTPRPTFPSTTMGPPPVMRLPRNLIPESYEIFLHPNQTLLFTGNSTVNFHCVERTRTIYLHSKDLTVSNPVVMNKNTNKKMGVSAVKHHEDPSNFLEIQLNDILEQGNYSLSLAFKGELSEYNEAFLAATNVAPTDARRVFPCFDEPEMKAVFHVTIIHRRDTTALGNAKMHGSNIIDDWKYTRFHPTQRMSTYLFAFMVSEFTSTSSPHDRVEIKTYARPEATAAGHAQYAANITGKILKFYENHFDIEYSQQKLDQIALPDLNPSAMENWGLVTYQEGDLLYEEGMSSLLHKELIANLIAHELAHQWFGNLVTMKWWNDIWLNEGFATYMSYYCKTFVANDLHTAFKEDALASSHPLSPPQEDVQTTSEIMEMFDAITYCKGAIVLRMLADIVEERVFNKGIKLCCNYKCLLQDLWMKSFKNLPKGEDGGHTEVAKVMDTWTKQIGYPVITINTTSGEIYQKHFLFNDSSESRFVLWWYIPIRVMSNTMGPSLVWLETTDTDEFISKNGEWILANVNCTGYYRVNYNQENWDSLLTQLVTNPHRIPLMNRGQLIDDAFNLARAKLLSVTLALNSTRFLRTEHEYLPWESAVRNLEYFILMFDRSEVYGPMQAYLREQVRGLLIYEIIVLPPRHNQIIAIQMACSNGLPECMMMAKEMFAKWMNNDTNNIHPNLRSVIYCQAVAFGGRTEWEFAWNKFQSSSDTSEKEQLRGALSCTKKIWLLSRYLEYTLNPERIRLMDVASTINYIARNVAGQALAWNFIRAHWEYVSQGDPAMLIEGVTSRFSTQYELEELVRFANDYDLGFATRAVQQAIEQTQVNIQWVSENKDIILEWFERETAL
uniref:Aminopeptidase n=1 Tax=Lates calcarifer TaxID=8187 RepID=A0A4W6ENH2_LATCA